MPIRPNLPVGVTAVTPPAAELYTKTALVARTDTTAFDAFVIPKNALVAGVYVLGQANSDSDTSAEEKEYILSHLMEAAY